ncbi:hypothetical protein AAG570_011905, partial [Ranatra chinensis]
FCSSKFLCRHSSYNRYFIDPVYKREQLRSIKESGEIEKFRHYPIKAAKSEETCSEFYDPLVEKFINYVMKCGKKELARQLVNKTFETVKRIQVQSYNKETNPELKLQIELDPKKIFYSAVENCKPILQVTPIKRGGATYQVPVSVTPKRALFLSMNWLIQQGKAEPNTTKFHFKLANELISASKNEGRVIKRKQELHKQCEANRAYAHYRWG